MNLSKVSLLFVLLCFVFACSKEDSPAPVNKEALTGSWRTTDIQYAGSTTVSMQNINVTSTFTGTGYDMDLTVSFAESPNTYTSSGDYSIELVTTTQGQTMTYNWTNLDFLDGGTWSLNGNKITIVSQAGLEQIATIKELTDNKLVMAYEETQTTNQNGATSTSTVKGTYTFARQ